MKKKKIEKLPTRQELEAELERVEYKMRYRSVFMSTVYTLITVAAIAILIATLWLPVLRIYGTSMAPTLKDGEIVFSLKTSRFQQGDIIAFYYNNKILVKRVIGQSGDVIDIEDDGTVLVNGKKIDEPYVFEKAVGECDIELPYQVPESKVFVMGDHRSVSIDSRSSAVGCVAEEQIVGKIVFCVWPFRELGVVR